MGVHRVLHWVPAEGGASGESFQAVTEALLCLGASSPAVWTLQVTFLRPLEARAQPLGLAREAAPQAAPPKPDLHAVSNELSYPHTIFLVSRKSRQVIEAETEALTMLDKYGMGKQRAALNLEGFQYRLGDLAVGVARATLRPSGDYKGLVIDVAYLPLESGPDARRVLEEAQAALEEAVGLRRGAALRLRATAAAVEADELPPGQHMALQYVETMSRLLQ